MRVEIDSKNYQPFPHLQGLLAEGYTIVNNPQKAFTTYIDAAMGYLDLDDLKIADQMIEITKSLQVKTSNFRNQYLKNYFLISNNYRITNLNTELLKDRTIDSDLTTFLFVK